jgi:hypothetical protein
MEGKLKEKLESTGIALLCLAIAKCNSSPVGNGGRHSLFNFFVEFQIYKYMHFYF